MPKSAVKVQYIAFSDSSEAGYASVVYLRSVCDNQNVDVKLGCAKTKLVPVKKKTFMRLEFFVTVLLRRLVNTVVKSLPINFDSIHDCSD